jgi:hypothetical protein
MGGTVQVRLGRPVLLYIFTGQICGVKCKPRNYISFDSTRSSHLQSATFSFSKHMFRLNMLRYRNHKLSIMVLVQVQGCLYCLFTSRASVCRRTGTEKCQIMMQTQALLQHLAFRSDF